MNKFNKLLQIKMKHSIQSIFFKHYQEINFLNLASNTPNRKRLLKTSASSFLWYSISSSSDLLPLNPILYHLLYHRIYETFMCIYIYIYTYDPLQITFQTLSDICKYVESNQICIVIIILNRTPFSIYLKFTVFLS